MNENPLMFRRAGTNDADSVLALYKSLVGTPFCAWDDSYPGMVQIQDDLRHDALFLLESPGKGGSAASLLAAAALRVWPEHDTLCPWKSRRPCDLMRIGVSPAFQHRGIGGRFLGNLAETARSLRFDGMRILVACGNLPALAMYRKFGAELRGNAESYGIHWICLERCF